jgi:hypothetical protein
VRSFVSFVISFILLSFLIIPSFRCQEPDGSNFEFEFVEFDDGQYIQISGGDGHGDYHAGEGDVLTLIVKVRNSGESVARNVTIALSVDEEQIKIIALRSIPPDENGTNYKTVIFSWVAVSGEHEIMIELDPDNDFQETNEGENNDPNKVIITVEVDEEISLPCMSFFVIPSLLMLLVLSILIISKRARSK